MIGALLSDLWPWLAAAGAALATVVGAWLKGRQDAKRQLENDAMKGVLHDLEAARRARRESDDPAKLHDDDGYRRP